MVEKNESFHSKVLENKNSGYIFQETDNRFEERHLRCSLKLILCVCVCFSESISKQYKESHIINFNLYISIQFSS